MNPELVIGRYNDQTTHAVEFFPAPRICKETLTREVERIKLSLDEAVLPIDLILQLRDAGMLYAQRQATVAELLKRAKGLAA